ncbi:MAG: biotin--[acetyl-CoA-carboxylase] ligase [Deltaproteobacteria bacterium HGW-Deltaproteobacteria-4]|nr:MAG: biotin--[acetyl-CoA-carboxylase] ligase [Deltaproteobacteria bacterium HGW-Deltaproteobacteria-4]
MSAESHAEILRLLKETAGGYLSSARLSAQLGISRAAIWKQIGVLREQGYAINALPSKGYRLAAGPDRLFSEEIQDGLKAAIIGSEIVYFAETDSTNHRAALLAEGGARDGTVIVAEAQSAGKGRLGRRWISPAGVNLYLSIILRPAIAPRSAPLLTFLSSLATARTIELETGLRPTVKWPNDVLLGGCKVAGLLNEMNAETERVNYVILGIGVNLNMTQEQFPDDLRYPATSLALALQHPVDRVRFCRRLLSEIDILYRDYPTGQEAILSGWLTYFDLLDKKVTIEEPSRSIVGIITGIAADGALLLSLENGDNERILAGDVRPLP